MTDDIPADLGNRQKAVLVSLLRKGGSVCPIYEVYDEKLMGTWSSSGVYSTVQRLAWRGLLEYVWTDLNGHSVARISLTSKGTDWAKRIQAMIRNRIEWMGETEEQAYACLIPSVNR